MNSFAAIDFETANNCRTSVCSVGVVVVRNGIVVNRIYRLISPSPNYYSYWNTQIHGLSYRDTYNAPEFPLVWAEIAPQITGLTLVAHNSPFDQGCLKAVHDLYVMPYPEYEFQCTLKISRKLMPQLPNHKLHTVSAHCGYNLLNHHHALADAEAAAVIMMYCQREY